MKFPIGTYFKYAPFNYQVMSYNSKLAAPYAVKLWDDDVNDYDMIELTEKQLEISFNASTDKVMGIVGEANSSATKSTKAETGKLNDQEAEKQWKNLTDIPFDEDEEGRLLIAEDWLHFEKGTEREDIWHWFDDLHSKGVHYLLYEFDPEGKVES